MRPWRSGEAERRRRGEAARGAVEPKAAVGGKEARQSPRRGGGRHASHARLMGRLFRPSLGHHPCRANLTCHVSDQAKPCLGYAEPDGPQAGLEKHTQLPALVHITGRVCVYLVHQSLSLRVNVGVHRFQEHTRVYKTLGFSYKFLACVEDTDTCICVDGVSVVCVKCVFRLYSLKIK